MPILFLFVGKTKEGYVREGIEKYASLVGRFVPTEVREIKGSASSDKKRAIEEEADAILERVERSDFFILLDERGREFTSEAFALELGRAIDSGKRIVISAGGPFGLSERVKARADLVLSLSRLTFTHEMARLIVMEQFYRAFTIIRGMTYHY